MTSVEIRRYEAATDVDSVFELWSRSLGRDWPVDRADLAAIVRDGFVAVLEEGIVGIAAYARAGSNASMQLLLVEPKRRRRGIGRKLHDLLLGELGRQGVTRLRLGGTPGAYLWPGLPADLADLRALLERWGWSFGDPCWDLARSLANYETPADVAEVARGVGYRYANDNDREQLTSFEASHFPQWAVYFGPDEARTSAIIAVDDADAIVGSLLATGRPQLWRGLLGEQTGEIGAVGVAETMRGRGIGTGIVAYACEQLRERGVGHCHIGWTVLLSFYGRLGFRPWRRYETAGRQLSGSSI